MLSLTDPQHEPLRRRLDDLIFENADEMGLSRQAEEIARLAKSYPHSIRLASATRPDLPRRERFTCHAYALGIHDSKDVRRHLTRLVFPNAEFVRRLVGTILVEVDEEAEDALVVYFGYGAPEHSGRWQRGRVWSKWGLGHVWEHALHEVPITYGDTVRFFRRLSRADAIAAYVEYAKDVDPVLRRTHGGAAARS